MQGGVSRLDVGNAVSVQNLLQFSGLAYDDLAESGIVFFSGRIRNAVNDVGELGQVIVVALGNVRMTIHPVKAWRAICCRYSDRLFAKSRFCP